MVNAFTPPPKRSTTKIGTLPPHLAAMMQTNINVQSLTVEAALTGKKHLRSIYWGVALRRANQIQTITATDASNNTGDGTSPSIGQAHIIVRNDCNN